MLVLLDGHVAVGPVRVDVENEVVVHFLCELAGGDLIGLAVDRTLLLVHALTTASRGRQARFRLGRVVSVLLSGCGVGSLAVSLLFL